MEDTKPKPFVFVLMPFSSDFTDVYEVGIKPACKDAGAYCERVDEQIFVENILERVYNQIAKADVIVAEMTGRNPNVFYETGYAHALNKRVILLTQTADDIPFDLKHYPHIVYGGRIAALKQQLESRVKWCLDNPQKQLTSVDVDLELLIDGTPLVNKPEIEVISEWGGPRFTMVYGSFGYRIGIRIGIHNSTNRIVSSDSHRLAMVTPTAIEVRGANHSPLPDDQIIWNLDSIYSIFPDGWHSFDLDLLIDTDEITDDPFDSSLRLFTELGPKDFQFSFKIEQRA